jgi:hypothetical protein
MKLAVTTFDFFRQTMDASMVHGGGSSSKVVTDAPQATITSKKVGIFQSGHRCDAAKWMKLKGVTYYGDV